MWRYSVVGSREQARAAAFSSSLRGLFFSCVFFFVILSAALAVAPRALPAAAVRGRPARVASNECKRFDSPVAVLPCRRSVLNGFACCCMKVSSSGSLTLDLALGVGGYPKGRVVEIYGGESSGKTTLALHAIAQIQKSGGNCCFIDVEHALDPRFVCVAFRCVACVRALCMRF
jgi:hypothetical protein